MDVPDVERDERFRADALVLPEGDQRGRVHLRGVQVEAVLVPVRARCQTQLGEQVRVAAVQAAHARHRVAVPDALAPGTRVEHVHVVGSSGTGLEPVDVQRCRR